MKNKHAAMEMSVGTIVTIVLLMGVLVLGIFLVQKIFKSSVNAIDTVDKEVQSQLEKIFADENKKIAVYPPSRDVRVKKGEDPAGFAFTIRNKDVESAEFTYVVEASDVSKCGSSFTKDKADSYLLGGSGTFNLGAGNSLDLARLVRLDVPETAPPCTIIYNLEVAKDGEPYTGADIYVTIK